MATNPETRLTRRLVDRLKTRKADGERLWWVKVHATGFSMVGTPDLLLCYEGVFIGVEVKNPGKKATPIQALQGQMIGEAGGFFAVVHEVAGLDKLLDDVAGIALDIVDGL